MNVVSFYRFTDVDDPQKLRGRLQVMCERAGMLGTVLVASEGVNGTLAGSAEAIQSVFDWIREALSLKEPTRRAMVRCRRSPVQAHAGQSEKEKL